MHPLYSKVDELNRVAIGAAIAFFSNHGFLSGEKGWLSATQQPETGDGEFPGY